MNHLTTILILPTSMRYDLISEFSHTKAIQHRHPVGRVRESHSALYLPVPSALWRTVIST